MGFLAYNFHKEESATRFNVRLEHARNHIQQLHLSTLRETWAGDARSGFVGWEPSGQEVNWPFFSWNGKVGIAWIHVPGLAGQSTSGVKAEALADSILDGRVDVADVGTPFALAKWRAGHMTLLNDIVGLVRLFHFSFEDGDVWTTRQGLAHIFMAEEPRRNSEAWASMGVNGWALNGETQVGQGKQLAGGTKVHSRHDEIRREVQTSSFFGAWLERVRSGPEPSEGEQLRDIEMRMLPSDRWPQRPVADLSGGKDSRLIAAVGIRSHLISGVSTINSDSGDLSTARQLMASAGPDFDHKVSEPSPTGPRGGVLSRVRSLHRAYEGRFVAQTAVKSPQFSGYRPKRSARFNGLTGPYGAEYRKGDGWQDFSKTEPGAARRRLQGRINKSPGSAASKQIVLAQIDTFYELALGLGSRTAGDVMDLFDLLNKTPNWTIPSAQSHVIFPLLNPSLLAKGIQGLKGRDYWEDQRQLLILANPSWAGIPFYKGSSSSRVTPFVWDYPDWAETEAFLQAQTTSSSQIDKSAVDTALKKIGAHDEVGIYEETVITRLIFNLTFDQYLETLREEVRKTRDELVSV